MSKKTKIILGSAIAVLIVFIALFPSIKRFFYTSTASSNTEKPVSESNTRQRGGGQPLAVTFQVLGYETLKDPFSTFGILLPDEEVDLSFETAGKITNIFFHEGAAAVKGQLLAKVNDKPLQAELQKILAQLPLAEGRVERQKTLLEKEAVSQETYEQVVTDLAKLRADADLVRARIAQTELRAPFDGIIGLRQVSEGAYVAPTTVVTHLTKIAPLKIEFSLNQRQSNAIKAGTPVTFTTENDLIKRHAQVYAIEPKYERQTLTIKARALYANTDRRVKPGQSVPLEINLNTIDNTLVIPGIATIAEMGKNIVFIYHNGKAVRREVQKGLRTESSLQITDGLQKGDTLITSGVMQLRDGMTVVLIK